MEMNALERGLAGRKTSFWKTLICTQMTDDAQTM
jgi:hypothetical protein